RQRAAQSLRVAGGIPPVTAGHAPPPPMPVPSAAQTPERAAVAESLKGPPAAHATPAAAKTAIPSEAVVGTTAQRSSSNRRTYAYISAGAAAVFIGGGLLFAARASKYDDELNARPHPQATIDDLSSTAKSSRTLSAILLGAGAAAGIGAGLLFFLPSGDGVAVQGRF